MKKDTKSEILKVKVILCVMFAAIIIGLVLAIRG